MVFSHQWSCCSRVFSIFDDTLTLGVAYGKRRSCFKALNNVPEEIKLAHSDIADKFREQGQGECHNVSWVRGTKVSYDASSGFDSQTKLYHITWSGWRRRHGGMMHSVSNPHYLPTQFITSFSQRCQSKNWILYCIVSRTSSPQAIHIYTKLSRLRAFLKIFRSPTTSCKHWRMQSTPSQM